MIEIGHQIRKVVEIRDLNLNGHRLAAKLNDLENELLFGRGYPWTPIFLFI